MLEWAPLEQKDAIQLSTEHEKIGIILNEIKRLSDELNKVKEKLSELHQSSSDYTQLTQMLASLEIGLTKQMSLLQVQITNSNHYCLKIAAKSNWQYHSTLLKQKINDLVNAEESEEVIKITVDKYQQQLINFVALLQSTTHQAVSNRLVKKNLIEQYQELTNESKIEEYEKLKEYINTHSNKKNDFLSQTLTEWKLAVAAAMNKIKSGELNVVSFEVTRNKFDIINNQLQQFRDAYKNNHALIKAIYSTARAYAEERGLKEAEKNLVI